MISSEETGYSPFNEYSWNNDREDNGVGKDETGMALALQIKMTFLNDSQPLLHAFRRESFHCFTKYRPWYSYIKTHEALTARIECFSVVQSKAGFVHEEVDKFIMSEAQSTAVQPDKE